MTRHLFQLLIGVLFYLFLSPLWGAVDYSVVDSDPNVPGVTIFSNSNQIVRDSNGNIYVAYGIATNQSTHWYCFIRRSTDGGASWEDAVRVESFPDSSYVYSLAVDSKDNLMMGLGFNVGSFFTMSTDGGKSWKSPIQLLDGGWGRWDWMPSISIDSKDGIHSAFHAQYGWQMPPSNILYTYSSDGNSFSTPEDLTKLPQESSYGNGAGPANLQIGKDDEIFIMGAKSITGDADSYSILLHYSGGVWLDEIRLNDDGVAGSGGDFVIDSSGKLHIFIAQIDPLSQKRRITYKTYDPSSKELKYVAVISAEDENVMNISAGIYENDLILVAYDLYDSTNKVYKGVYLKKSDDSFAKTYLISDTVGARSPNLRSYYNNMYNKDKMDIIWVEPDIENGGEILAYYEISGGIKPAGKAKIDVFVPYFMNPGQEVNIVVRYSNTSGEDITNAAVVLDIPSDFIYLNSSGGGIYKDREGSPQVFWRLGTLKDQSKGSQYARFLIPWGMPDVKGKIVANLIGENIYSNYDSKKYYAYESRDVLLQIDLSETEIDTILKSDEEMKRLLDYSTSLGYVWNKVGQRIRLSNDTEIISLYLMDPTDYSPLIIKRAGTLPVFAEQTQGSRYTRFDTEGGYTINSSTDEFISFGKWAESHSLTEARCQLNCTINKVPGWIGEAVSKTYNMASTAINCISCAKSKGKEVGDCINCLNAYKDIPGVSYAVDVAQCLKDCLENPNQHICTEDKRECNWSVIGVFSGQDTVFVTPCNKVTGTYDPVSRRLYCAYGEKCIDGQCVDNPPDPCGKRSIVAPAPEAGVCKLDDFEIVKAHDPNAISVVPDGDILPDETLTYTIEYENTGSGKAFNVFILNQLDENLDESTLVINNNGKFSSASRILMWEIGELEAGQKGSVSYSVKPIKGIEVGTVISNFAEVHFPSAGEVTPTNIIASKVSTLSADNLSIELSPKEKKEITLSARGIQGAEFKIISYPKFGSIKVNSPKVEYTAPDNFIGTDRFTYVAIKGNNVSSPATVSINIKGEDTTPPSIIKTYPVDGEKGVRFSTDPLADNTYYPEIWVQFDEDIDKDSVATYNIYLKKLDESIVPVNLLYEATTRRVLIRPLSPLEPSTEYRVTLSYIYDLSENPMSETYQFKFKTVANKELNLAMSDRKDELDFGRVQINSKESKTVSLSSVGLSSVNITEVKLNQSGKEFSIAEDKCSSKAISPGEDCHIRIDFSPIAKGMKGATLTISSDDEVKSLITVNIKGEAVEASITDAGTDTGEDQGSTTTETKDNGGCGCSYIE